MKSIQKHPSEQGSALLLTLGILAFVLLLSVTFVFSSRTELSVAKANAENIATNLLLDSAATHAVKDMTQSFAKRVKDSLNSESSQERHNLYVTPFPALHQDDDYPADAPLAPFSDHRIEDAMAYTFIRYGINQPERDQGETADDDEKQDLDTQLKKHHPLYAKIKGLTFKLADAQFHYLTNPQGNIIGRYAYLIIADGEKLDLNQMIACMGPSNTSSGQDVKFLPYVLDNSGRLISDLFSAHKTSATETEGQQIAPFFYYNLDGNYFATPYCKPQDTLRLGLLPQELPPLDLNVIPNGSGSVLPWTSYLQLLGLNDDDTELFKHYRLYSLNEPEAFQQEINPSDHAAIEYSRFDITGYEQSSQEGQQAFYGEDNRQTSSFWNTVKPEKLMAPLSSSAQFPHVAETIPYLQKLEDVDKIQASNTTSKAPQHLGLQVAANLIDYSDSDDKATVDDDFFRKIKDKTDWSNDAKPLDTADEPSYWGNERVAYINEVAFQIKLERKQTVGGNNSVDLVITPKIELANIFNQENIPSGELHLLVTFELKIDNQRPKTFTSCLRSTAANTNLGSQEYHLVTMTSYQLQDLDLPAPSDQEVKVRIKFNKVQAITWDPAAGAEIIPYDYASWISRTDNPDSPDIPVTVLEASVPNQRAETEEQQEKWKRYFYSSLEVKDPRFNHKTTEWQWKKNASKDCFEIEELEDRWSLASLGMNNSYLSTLPDFSTPPADLDEETRRLEIDRESYKSIHFSTAYIKNAPMETFWELGAIHRGEAFRTLNLNVFSDSAGDYGQGDAEILDQLKIGPLKVVKGRYNANANNAQAMEILLNGIDPEKSGTQGNASPYELKNMTFSPCSDKLHYTADTSTELNRAIFANRLDTSAFTTDRDREAFIGRTANLLTTRSDPYTVLIVAQSLKEINKTHYDSLKKSVGDDMDRLSDLIVNPLEVGDRRFSILGTKTMTLYLIRDAWTNQFTTVHREIHNR